MPPPSKVERQTERELLPALGYVHGGFNRDLPIVELGGYPGIDEADHMIEHHSADHHLRSFEPAVAILSILKGSLAEL